MDDAALIRRYLLARSEADFTELVQRHLPMVRRAALRQTQANAAMADEVAQAVFVRFARKLPNLANHPALAGWLHTATRHAASEALRSARRRRQHEQEAHRMSQIDRDDDRNAANWDRIQPVLDAALRRLSESDREAILLRYFENRPLGAIATQVGVKEDAARMRINRALARLRSILGSRGILTTEAALAALLEADRAVAEATVAPAACATVAHGALAGASSATGSALSFSQLTTTAMAMKKSLLVAGLIGAVIGGFTTFHYGRSYVVAQRRQAHRFQVENDRLRDRITRNLLAAKAGVAASALADSSPSGLGANSTPAASANARISALGADVKLRAASRDALPTAVAHPLKFRGYDTPLDGFESFAWSTYMGDADMVARSIYLDDAARAAVEKLRETLSPEMRAQYPTPEALVGLLFAYDSIRSPGPNSEDFLVDLPQPPGKYLDADDFQGFNGVIFHRTADGWKYTVPGNALGTFVNAQLHPGGS